jgi:hypothetical protein
MVAQLSPSSWTASNTAVAVLVVAQETQEQTLRAELHIQVVVTVDVAITMPQVSAPMQSMAQEAAAVVVVTTTAAAHSPPAAQEAQALLSCITHCKRKV